MHGSTTSTNAPVKTADTYAALEDTGKGVQILAQVVSDLEERLNPVLRFSDPVKEGGVGLTPPKYQSPLANTIDDLSTRLALSVNKLRDMIQRLEV